MGAFGPPNTPEPVKPVMGYCRFCTQRYKVIEPRETCPHPVSHECQQGPELELGIRAVEALENIASFLESLIRSR
jgi:hypothetical protein